METFRSLPIPARLDRVDATQGILRRVSVATAAQAAGHRLLFDHLTLRQLADLGNQSPGVKVRFAHPALLEDGLGKYLGRMTDFRLEADPLTATDRLYADLRLAQSAAQSPAGDLRAYVLSLAGEDPAAFGISVVVDLERVWVLSDGSELPCASHSHQPTGSLHEFPVARILKFHAADLVDEPALNPQGLFQNTDDTIQFTNPRKEPPMSETNQNQSTGPAPEPAPLEDLEARFASFQEAIRQEVAALQGAVSQQAVQIGGVAPRGAVAHSHTGGVIRLGPTGLEHFASAFEWVFGVGGAPLPPPELRRIDTLYRLITGDSEWHGVFQPEYAFAAATTSTLADLAANAMNKVIVQLYNRLTAYRWYEQLTAVQPTDGSLHDMAWVQFGGIANLPVVAEGAAYTELAVTDTKESDAFIKYGGYVGITDKMLRNSEIAKLQAIPRALTIAAVQTRSAAIAGIFTSNGGVGPTLDQDATALFHANHGNLATTAYSIAAWKAARLECAKQTELGSGKRQMLFPKFCLVPADLYDQALIDFGFGAGPGGYTGTPNNDVNPYAMDRPGDPRPTPVAVPEFTDANDWAYLVDPLVAPVICMAYANNPGAGGHPAPELFVAASELAGLMFTNDTLPIKIRDQFAYGVATYRGIGKRNVA